MEWVPGSVPWVWLQEQASWARLRGPRLGEALADVVGHTWIPTSSPICCPAFCTHSRRLASMPVGLAASSYLGVSKANY